MAGQNATAGAAVVRSFASLLSSKSDLMTMASSSLKKMSGVQEWKEGNYASFKTTSRDRFIACDLGLTLLPGSQICREDEKKLGTAAETKSQRSWRKYVKGSPQLKSLETGIQQKYETQETTSSDKTLNPSASSDPLLGPAGLPHVIAAIHQKRRFSRSFFAKDGSEAVQHNAGSFTAVSYAEQRMGTGEVGNDNNCQYDESLPRAFKKRKLVSKGKEVAFENHNNQSHVHRNQDLTKTNIGRSEKLEPSAAPIRSPPKESSESSKAEQCRQAAHSLNSAPASSHRDRILGSKDTALTGSPSLLAALTSESYRALNPSQLLSTDQRGHRRRSPDTPGDIGMKTGKEVKRSWTSHFPAKATIPGRASLPAPSFLAAQFTSREEYQRQYPNNVPLTSTNLQAYSDLSSIHPSLALPTYPNLPKTSARPHDVCFQSNISDIARAGIWRQSVPRRSASMPNLLSTAVPMSMVSSNSGGSALMPTPPREQSSSPACHPCSSSPSSNPFRQCHIDPLRGHVHIPFNADNSPSPNWHFNTSPQRKPEISLSNRQNLGFASGPDPHQVSPQPSNRQDMTNPSGSKDGTMAVGEPQSRRRRLEVKSNYSSEEVKSLMSSFVRQARVLQAENSNLQSLNAAMAKGFESLQRETAELSKQNQRYERICAQKQQQLETLCQKSSSLQQHFKLVWDERNQLLATKRKEQGIGNPSAVAKKIRLDHSLNTASAASQGSQTSANVSSMLRASGVQMPTPRRGFEQTPTGFHRHVQQVSVPGLSETNVFNVSSQLLSQQGYANGNHNKADSLQTVPIPACSETGVAKASSPGLSQPGCAATYRDSSKLLQSVSIPVYPEANVFSGSSQASMQPGFAAANHDKANLPQDESNQWVYANQPLGAVIRTATTSEQNNRPMEQLPAERVTIDLTHDYPLPSPLASCHTSDNQACQPPVRNGYPLFDLSSSHYPAGHSLSSQHPSVSSAQMQTSQNQLALDQNSQGENLEAMRIQKEAFARMAKKPLSWLQGENPFRKGTKTKERAGLENTRQPSGSNAEEHAHCARSPETGSVAPPPEIATDRMTKKKAPTRTRVFLDAEAKRERAKVYRKTAAEKKKREMEIAQQFLPDEDTLNNPMRAQKQDRRAAKGGKRRGQGRKTSEEAGPHDSQKTLDGRLYREDTAIQQATPGGSMEQATSDDLNSLFGDSEAEGQGSGFSADADSVLHLDNMAATQQEIDAAYVAEVEAELEADVDAGRMAGVEQGDVFNGRTSVPTTYPNGDDGYPGESEESEEE